MEALQKRITAREYFQLPAYENEMLIQLIDGQVVTAMPPIPRHQFIVGEVFAFLRLIARETGGRALMSPIEVFLNEHNVLEPDVLYLAPDSACEVGAKRLMGPPDLIVEVLSPSTARYDRGEKYRAYERHGVREYWIIDPAHETLEVWQLTEGAFQRLGAYASGMRFASVVLTRNVDVAAFWSM